MVSFMLHGPLAYRMVWGTAHLENTSGINAFYNT